MKATKYTNLEFTRLACDTLMKKFKAADLPPTGKYHYHQGVFLSGVENVYDITRDEKYITYVKEYIDSQITMNGEIINHIKEDLDDLQPSLLLFLLYEITKDERYNKVIKKTAQYFSEIKTNPEGGFWHKGHTPDQMWLDGLYMAGPFMAEYAKKYNCPKFFDIVYTQMYLMKKHMFDSQTGLLYHGWDYSKKMEWSDSETGCSAFFWGRSIGWYIVAITDILDCIPENYEKRQDFIDTGAELINAIVKFQDKNSGRWYQIVNRGADPKNWLENSCSCLFTYAISKAVRKGYIDREFEKIADMGYNGVLETIGFTDDNSIILDHICIGTGIADYDYYLNRPTCINDLHGMGALLLMCTEYHRLKNS